MSQQTGSSGSSYGYGADSPKTSVSNIHTQGRTTGATRKTADTNLSSMPDDDLA